MTTIFNIRDFKKSNTNNNFTQEELDARYFNVDGDIVEQLTTNEYNFMTLQQYHSVIIQYKTQHLQKIIKHLFKHK